MTKQRFSDIEDAILVGLLEAPEHKETPFKIDPQIFTTPLKRKIATTINSCIDNEMPEMALYNIENAVDSTEAYQAEWIDIQGDASKLGFGLPISVISRYYVDLSKEISKTNGDRI